MYDQSNYRQDVCRRRRFIVEYVLMPRPTALLVGQSGGPTAAINSSLLGVIKAALGRPEISHVYGAVDGGEGLLEGRVIDLGQESRSTLAALRHPPAAALGSCRYKLRPEDPDRLLALFQQLGVGYIVYIGGN